MRSVEGTYIEYMGWQNNGLQDACGLDYLLYIRTFDDTVSIAQLKMNRVGKIMIKFNYPEREITRGFRSQTRKQRRISNIYFQTSNLSANSNAHLVQPHFISKTHIH